MKTLTRDLTRDAILGHDDGKVVPVDVPEWGGTVHVKVLSGSERDRWEIEHAADPGTDVRARLLAYACCEPDGTPLFSAADVEALGRKSGAALQRLFKVARRINLLTSSDIDELEGNSEAGR